MMMPPEQLRINDETRFPANPAGRSSRNQGTDKSLTDLANMFNPTMRSWIAYYGRFYRSALVPVFRPLDYALTRWAMRKYKGRFQGHQRRSSRWLQSVARHDPKLFAHWAIMRTGMAGR